MCSVCNKIVCSRDKPGKGVWTEENEEELRSLYMENQSNPQTDQGTTKNHNAFYVSSYVIIHTGVVGNLVR